jgi:hypothetical protein
VRQYRRIASRKRDEIFRKQLLPRPVQTETTGRKRSQLSDSDRLRRFSSPHGTEKRKMTMTTFKILIGAALVSLATITAASAQLPSWAISNPDLYEAQYPNRDILNDGALTPAGRMGLEFAHGAAPVFGAGHAYAATGRAMTPHRAPRYPGSADR